MSEDFRNKDGEATGNAANGTAVVLAGRGSSSLLNKTYDANGYFTYDIANFDSGDYTTYKDRLDDPRYYSGDSDT